MTPGELPEGAERNAEVDPKPCSSPEKRDTKSGKRRRRIEFSTEHQLPANLPCVNGPYLMLRLKV
jgi:hypothetical protein